MNGRRSWPPTLRMAILGMEMCCLYPALASIKKGLGWGLASFCAILLCYPAASILKMIPAEGTGTLKRRRLLLLMGPALAVAAFVFSALDLKIVDDVSRFSQENLLKAVFQACLLYTSPSPRD